MASRALAPLNRERETAAAEVKRLEAAHVNALCDALIEHAGGVATRYLAAYRALADLHDELAGISQILAEHGRLDIARGAAEFSIPNFTIPPLNNGAAEFFGYLTHRGDVGITRAASRWRAIAGRLLADPLARVPTPQGDAK